MRKKYRKTGPVILSIFIVAVVCVCIAFFVVYQNGIRYIKSEAGVKYFGNVDKYGNITNGRMWFASDAATVSRQKFYIIEATDAETAETLPSGSELEPGFISGAIFNRSGGGILFRNETFDVLIKDYDGKKNNFKSGEIYTSDGIKWVLVSTNSNPSSYKDFEAVQENDKSNKYKGDILDFVRNEEILSASFILKNGNVINLYPAAADIYRVCYDKGVRAGDLYIGSIDKNFEKNGAGIYYYDKTGGIYYGEFKNDERNGKCEFLSAQGDRYVGYIQDGKNNGEGTLTWSDGTSYTGTFKDNMKNGRGVNVFSDGSVYEGDYLNDVKHGRGKYTWASGDVYEGEFENDLYKGYGKYTWESGDYYEGEFKYNTLHGWGTYYWTSGRTYEGWWDMGKMVHEAPSDIGDDAE